MIIGTAGHIDHGKTALVRALTGVDTDRLPEEKRRGITIELGFAPLTLPGLGTVGIVDVPGHEAFVRTMVAGATGIDVALLVIAADEGVMPQTREHVAILTLLGTRAGVVALTKCDLVDDDWLSLVRADIAEALRGSPLEDARVVAVSSVSGAGLGPLRDALGAAVASVPARVAADAFRMPVDRAFTVRGTGTVVTGTIWSGRVAAGDALLVQPGNQPVRVRGVQSHGADVPAALPGSRAAIAVSGANLSALGRGAWLTSDPAWPVTTLVRADVTILPDATHVPRAREWLRLHVGTADVGARVVSPGGPLQPGGSRPARIVLQEPVLVRAGDRFVLRLASPPVTIGGGLIVDPLPPRRRAAPWPWMAPGEATVMRVLLEAGPMGVLRDHLAIRAGLTSAQLSAILPVAPVAVIGTRVVAADAVAAAARDVLRAVDAFHEADPLGEGVPTAGLATELRVPGDVLDQAISDLAVRGTVERRGAVLVRAGWQPTMNERDLAFRDALVRDLVAAGTEPPDVSELAERHGRDPVRVLRALEREGTIVGVEAGRFYAANVVEDLLQQLRAGMTPGREYSPAELRELLGLSRKYLIPFLEYCDRKRHTERRATGRVWLAAMA